MSWSSSGAWVILFSIYRALAEHEKTQSYPDAVEQAHVDFAALQPST